MRCVLSCTFHVTDGVADKDDLWLQFPLLDPGQEPHPGEDWQKLSRQDEGVGDIMITPRTQLEGESSALQTTQTSSNQTVSLPTALVR